MYAKLVHWSKPAWYERHVGECFILERVSRITEWGGNSVIVYKIIKYEGQHNMDDRGSEIKVYDVKILSAQEYRSWLKPQKIDRWIINLFNME